MSMGYNLWANGRGLEMFSFLRAIVIVRSTDELHSDNLSLMFSCLL